jgi:ATP-dependent phosphofructokinase / diphosphate-dependent phosphofructokinase
MGSHGPVGQEGQLALVPGGGNFPKNKGDMTKKRIGVLTSGGDCPGLNAVIRGVVRSADKLGWEVVGFRDGYEGLLPDGGDYMVLDRRATAGIMHLGGTMIGTTNRGHFVAKIRAGEKAAIPDEIIEKARKTFNELGLTGLVTIGGDGSLTTALQLHESGFPVIGVPKTIDNDLQATAMTFGFDSAVSCVADALDRLHTTATSHKRVMVLEVMGRHAGWIALYGGLAGGADVILIPEIPFDFQKVADQVMLRDREGAKSTMIVVAEGASAKSGNQMRMQTSSGEYRLGGIGELVSKEVGERTGKETRVCVLGHLQRGGAPTALDRILGTRFGVQAVKLIEQERFGMMVSYQNYETKAVPIAEAVHRLRVVNPTSQMVQTARAVDITFGD